MGNGGKVKNIDSIGFYFLFFVVVIGFYFLFLGLSQVVLLGSRKWSLFVCLFFFFFFVL